MTEVNPGKGKRVRGVPAWYNFITHHLWFIMFHTYIHTCAARVQVQVSIYFDFNLNVCTGTWYKYIRVTIHVYDSLMESRESCDRSGIQYIHHTCMYG